MTAGAESSPMERVARGADRLRDDLRLPWPADAAQAVARLCLDSTSSGRMPAMVALMGGASSGKSTIFDNLLGGRLTSRITARGHATLGPILAVHESRHSELAALIESARFLPGYQPQPIELNDNNAGRTGEVAIARHAVDALRDVLLFDLPDFTSGAAAEEGDVALSLMPWFDRIIMVLDHERWFDRQSNSSLRERSVRFGHERWVVFNQTQDAELSEEQRRALTDQATPLTTDGMSFLEHRRGRGLCRFPPTTFDDVVAFASEDPPDRGPALRRFVAGAVNELLNQNEERAVRLDEMRGAIDKLIGRTVPDQRACMVALMTTEERRQTEWLARIFRINETRNWLSGQTRRFTSMLRQVPVLGAVLAPGQSHSAETASEQADRLALGRALAERVADRHRHELKRLIRSSRFWNEVRRWTGMEPSKDDSNATTDVESWLGDSVSKLDQAIQRWNECVEAECAGVTPHFRGAVGAGTIALAVVLIAVPGPVTALTAVAAKGAVAAALTQIFAATGVGALAGRSASRFASVVQEKLLGSAEYAAVQASVEDLRSRLGSLCARMNDRALSEAMALVLPSDDSLSQALEQLRNSTGDRG